MKLCPICQSSYEDAVDFCFKDGAPLESTEAAAPAEDHRTGFAGLSADDLEPPDAISLSNIPAVDVDDEAVTQTLPIDLPDAEEYDRITTSGALEPVSDPIDRDVTGIVDPFGGHEEEAFRARLAETDGPAPAVEDVDETLQDEEESDDAAAAPVPAKAATPAKAAPKPAGKSGRRPRTKPSSAGGAPPKTRPRKRPEDFGKRESSDNRGLFMFVGLVALLLIAFIGWQAMKKPSGETIAHSGQPPAPTDVRADEPEATPAPEITFEDEPTPDPEAELAEGDSAPSEGDEDVASEDGETPGEDEPETADEVEEPTSEPVAIADPAAERRAEEARAAREARRLELEEERRRRAA